MHKPASDLRIPLRSATLLIMEPSGITAFRQLECRASKLCDTVGAHKKLVARLDNDDDFAGAILQIPESALRQMKRRTRTQQHKVTSPWTPLAPNFGLS